MRLNCAFCGTKHRPDYIEKHIHFCRMAKLHNLTDHTKIFQNSEPEPPADFPDFYKREDDPEEGF